MKVVVLSGGVIGVSAAYHLARAGAEVQVVDRYRTAARPQRQPRLAMTAA